MTTSPSKAKNAKATTLDSAALGELQGWCEERLEGSLGSPGYRHALDHVVAKIVRTKKAALASTPSGEGAALGELPSEGVMLKRTCCATEKYGAYTKCAARAMYRECKAALTSHTEDRLARTQRALEIIWQWAKDYLDNPKHTLPPEGADTYDAGMWDAFTHLKSKIAALASYTEDRPTGEGKTQ